MENVKNDKLIKSQVLKFRTEGEEAAWWASGEGREFVKRKSATGPSKKQKGSSLVSAMNPALPAPDPANVRNGRTIALAEYRRTRGL